MGSASDAVPLVRPPPFVEVYTADGARRRFAAGTTAGFAIDRINSKEAEESQRYSFVESVKEGEEAVEFGPDAELVSYGEGWKLRAVQDAKFLKPVPFGVGKVETKDEMKAINRPVRKAKTKLKLRQVSVAISPDMDPRRVLNATDPQLMTLTIYPLGVAVEFNPADFYPGGKLPDCKPPEDTWGYFWNFSVMIGVLGLLVGSWVYLLEYLNSL